MFKRIAVWACLAFAASVATASSGFAQSQADRWGANAELLSSQGCQGVGAIDNFPALSTYRPKINNGEQNSALSFSFGRGSTIIQTTSSSSQLHGKGKYKGVSITGSVTFRDTKGAYNFDITPASVVSNTKTVKITGTISNFVGVKGCTVEISGTYKKL